MILPKYLFNYIKFNYIDTDLKIILFGPKNNYVKSLN